MVFLAPYFCHFPQKKGDNVTYLLNILSINNKDVIVLNNTVPLIASTCSSPMIMLLFIQFPFTSIDCPFW